MALLGVETGMTGETQGEVTKLLAAYAAGNQEAMNRLFELVYDELRGIANGLMRWEREDHTLQPTVLVHDVYMRLLGEKNLAKNLAGKNRRYFFGVATKAMLQILVEHARKRDTLKRVGDNNRVPIDIVLDNLQQTQRLDIVNLYEALQQLEKLDSRKNEVVMLRFFGGLSMKEIAKCLDVSLATVEKDWHFARAWLKRKLEADQ